MYPSQLHPAGAPAVQATPWYKQRWPWLLMLGPALVIVAGVITTFLAISRPDAVVVDDYYKRGKAINQDLRRDRAATSLRLAVDASYDAARGELTGRMQSWGRPFAAPIRLHLAHATQPEKDLVRAVKPDADGRFTVAVGHLDRARWEVVVEGEEREWRLATSWRWPQTGSFAIEADRAAAP